MRVRTLLVIFGLILFAIACEVSGPGTLAAHTNLISMEQSRERDTSSHLEEIVANYRKIIVLLADDASLNEITQDRAATLGRILFQQNQDLLSALSAKLTAEISKPTSATVSVFLNQL